MKKTKHRKRGNKDIIIWILGILVILLFFVQVYINGGYQYGVREQLIYDTSNLGLEFFSDKGYWNCTKLDAYGEEQKIEDIRTKACQDTCEILEYHYDGAYCYDNVLHCACYKKN